MNTHAVPPPRRKISVMRLTVKIAAHVYDSRNLAKCSAENCGPYPMQFRVTSSEFRNDVWYKKKLECYHIMIQTMTCSAVLKQFMSVTDGRTDGHC